MKLVLGAVLIATVCSVSAKADDKLIAFTPSGRAELVFYGLDREEASENLVNTCFDRGMVVIEQSPQTVTCEVAMDDFQSIFAQVMIGNSYSTRPSQFIRMNMASLPIGTRVQANSWVETQMALGQVRRQPLNSDNNINSMMQFLLGAGADWLPGTSFPNHAWLGVRMGGVEEVTLDGRERAALTIEEVFSGGSAEHFELQSGDQLLSINGKRFLYAKRYFHDAERRRESGHLYHRELDKQLRKYLRHATKQGEIEIEVLRGGELLTFSGPVSQRAPIAMPTEEAQAD